MHAAKTRWKEEQKEKALGQDGQGWEAQGKENQAATVPSPEEAAAVPAPGGSEPRCVLGEVKKGVGGSKGENTQMPVACVSGVPREPANAGAVVRVTPTGSGSGGPQGIMHEINQHYLRSKYKFKKVRHSRNISGRGCRASGTRARSGKCSRD